MRGSGDGEDGAAPRSPLSAGSCQGVSLSRPAHGRRSVPCGADTDRRWTPLSGRLGQRPKPPRFSRPPAERLDGRHPEPSALLTGPL